MIHVHNIIQYHKRNRLHSFASLYSNRLMSNCTVSLCVSMVKHPFFVVNGLAYPVCLFTKFNDICELVMAGKDAAWPTEECNWKNFPTILVEATWKVIGQAVAQWWQKHQRLQWSISLRRRALQCSEHTNRHNTYQTQDFITQILLYNDRSLLWKQHALS